MPSPPPPKAPLQAGSIGDPEPGQIPFSDDQIAIAFVLGKVNKPEGQTLEEYLANLARHAIQQANAPPAAGLRVVDTLEYFKEEHDRLWRENKSLKDENNLLKDEVSLLKRRRPQRTNTPRVHHLQPDSQESEESLGADRREKAVSRKRALDDYLEEFSFLKTNEASLNPIGTHIHRIISNREQLDKLSRAADSLPGIEKLTSFARVVCINLHGTLSECFLADPYTKNHDGNKQTLGMLTHISDLTIASFISVFQALNIISQTIEGRKQKGKLIYEMAEFFHKSLDLLHTLSNLQLEHERIDRNLRSKRARVQESEYVANKHLGRILSKIVYNLEWKDSLVHSELLQAILYPVLGHTGTILSKLSFGEHVAASKNPGNITENDGNAVLEEPTKHEMQYAIQILYNAIGGASKRDLFLKVVAGKQNSNQIRVASSIIDTPPGDLLKAEILLQSTLLKTTLGYDETDSLNPPSVPEDVSDMVDGWDAEEIYGPRWFAAQMWSLIGWDLVK